MATFSYLSHTSFTFQRLSLGCGLVVCPATCDVKPCGNVAMLTDLTASFRQSPSPPPWGQTSEASGHLQKDNPSASAQKEPFKLCELGQTDCTARKMLEHLSLTKATRTSWLQFSKDSLRTASRARRSRTPQSVRAAPHPLMAFRQYRDTCLHSEQGQEAMKH